MNAKQRTQAQIEEAMIKANSAALTGCAERLAAEARRYRLLAGELIIRSFHAKTVTPETAQLIRDHELRAETYKTAAAMILG